MRSPFIIATLLLLLSITTTLCKKKHRSTSSGSTGSSGSLDPDNFSKWLSDYWPNSKSKEKDHDKDKSKNKHKDSVKIPGLDLRGKLRKTFAYIAVGNRASSNVVSSPISALMPLGKLALGAEGKTFKELARAIGVKQHSEVQGHFKKILNQISTLPGVTLDIATSIYLDAGKKLKKSFEQKIMKVFDSSVNVGDFSKNYEMAQQINRWAAAQTHGKIRELVSPGDISKDTSIILVNAVYFTGRWLHPFERVQPGKFFAPQGQKEVPMLFITEYYKYYKSTSLDAQVISIPYEGQKATMLVVLPSKENGLSTLINQLKMAPQILHDSIKKLKRVKVRVTIPKFHIETELNLKDLYEKIGLKNIFSTDKDSGLKEMVDKEKLKVSTAKQKVYIDVNEWGTKAAAATDIVSEKISFQPNLQIFVANRPFLFFVIAHTQQLFSGIVANP